VDEGVNSSIEARNSSRGDLAQERLEFAVGHLNRIKVRPSTLEGSELLPPAFSIASPMPRPQVDSAVIHHDDVIAPERGYQALLDIYEEHLSGHGTLDHHRRRHYVVPQGGHEGDCLPCSKLNTARSL
jgi:hypothetical protein